MDKHSFIEWVRTVGPQYVSNDQVLEDLRGIELVAIVGPTGVGKTTLVDTLKMPIVKSDVTRPRRTDEKRDDTYHYRDDYDRMKQEIEGGEYVQFVVSGSGEFYGTRRSSYPEEGRCTISIIAGAVPAFKRLGFGKLSQIYVMPPGYVVWMKRIGSVRSVDIRERLAEARESIKSAMRDIDYQFILNDDLETAAKDIHRILNGEEVSEHRVRLARDTANMLLERLGDQDEEDLYL